MENKRKILVAPLNWGLGHTTRCIPIIQELLLNNYTPILASDGHALELLKKEFPSLKTIELPSYNIEYSKKGNHLKYKLFLDSPAILKSIIKEKRIIKQLVHDGEIDGIISDNRFGVHHYKVPSVFITHQLNVLSGTTTWLSSKIHKYIIKKFDECWVPDLEGQLNLSGILGHIDDDSLNLKYIGPLSRFDKTITNNEYDILAILSGPEPQRTFLEKELYKEFLKTDKKVLFVRGIIEEEEKSFTFKNITVFNYMTSSSLEHAINSSKIIVSRSGYTSIMDLAKLDKKAFFIPTPGQYEQEYLAERLQKFNLVPYCEQDDFELEKLEKINSFNGLKNLYQPIDYTELFSVLNQEFIVSDFSIVKENSEPTPNSLST
ncbi:MAG: glycosyltransferase [Flavobacteriaceae bacterium]|nr:glycosyltransferase [Flavobacteriaceae bacterium]